MPHAKRTLEVTTKGETNWKNDNKNYSPQKHEELYESDSTSETQRIIKASETAYKQWLKNQVADEREMYHLTLHSSHRLKYN